MTKDDLALFQSNMREALEHEPDGTTRRWENPATGASGTLTPVSTYEQDGANCRRLEIVNTVQGVRGRSTFNMCKRADGAWVSSNIAVQVTVRDSFDCGVQSTQNRQNRKGPETASGPFLFWRPQGDSNPCYRRERAMS